MERSRSFGDLDFKLSSPNMKVSSEFMDLTKGKQDKYEMIKPGTYVSLKQTYGSRGYHFDKTTDYEEVILKFYKIGTTIGRILTRNDVYCTILRLDIYGRYVTDLNVWVGFMSRITKEEFLNAEISMKNKLSILHEERSKCIQKIKEIRDACPHRSFSFFLGSKKIKGETSQCKICGKILAFKFRLEGKDYVHVMEEKWYKEAKEREKVDFSGEEITIKDKIDTKFSRKEVHVLMIRDTLTKKEAALAMFNFGD